MYVLKVAHVPLSREHHALQLPSPGSTMLLSPSLESDIHTYMYMYLLPSPLRDSGSSWSGNDILYSGFLIWRSGGLGKKNAKVKTGNIKPCDPDSLVAGLNHQIKKYSVLAEIAKFNGR